MFSCVLCTSRCSISQEAVKSSKRNVWPSPSPGSTRRGGLERKRAESLSFVYKSWVGLSASLLDNPAYVVHVVQLLPNVFLVTFHPKKYDVITRRCHNVNQFMGGAETELVGPAVQSSF